jgi:ATP-dependent Lon protease
MAQREPHYHPFLPLRQGVTLPGAVTPIPVGRERSLALVDALAVGDRLVVGVQFDPRTEEPTIAEVHPIGVIGIVRDRRPRGRRGGALLFEALERVNLTDLRRKGSHWETRIDAVQEVNANSAEAKARADSLRRVLRELAEEPTIKTIVDETRDPGLLADRVAGLLDLPGERKIEVLRALDVEARLTLVTGLLQEVRARTELREKIDSEVRKGFSEQQREAVLRQQLRAIQKELGEGDDGEDDLARLRDRLAEADLPDEIRKVADRELRRLTSMQGAQAESHVIRNYLEWIADLPWKVRAQASTDIDAVAVTLDEDHYGLDEVKRRILEHMAVLKLSSKTRGTILALVGPPGVGKTSLAQSVARATGRPLARVSLGGIRDEAEIRGHRRTYVGALPGRIISALRKAGVKNPVMVLDEIDKLGRGWAGDPEAALLEVLDPEQNSTFTDHYMELPFDLSEVLFIATANELSTLSPPLRDRIEIIEVNGYTLDEKVHIAGDHLWPKKLEDHGLSAERVALRDELIATIIKDYTREAGVRQLARMLERICRSVALDVARDREGSGAITEAELRRILGRPKFIDQMAEHSQEPGVAAGLAWTPVGGDILYVETTKMPGKGTIEITGQLGEVMNESARAALAYLRSHADEVGADPNFLDKHDLHIHVPAGAVPKDGPSAGVTMFTALASLLSGRQVRPDTAMTGEATLRGRVLPVGGIKSKLLAAHRAGFTRVVLPKLNERDLEDVPEAVRAQLDIVLADDMRDVLHAALVGDLPPVQPRPPSAPVSGPNHAPSAAA